MHLMLRVDTAGDDAGHDGPIDVVATVEPNHTVDELRAALVRYSRRNGASLVRGRTGQVLSADATLGEIGLVSGEILALTDGGRTFAAQDIDGPRVSIEAVGGPASGWRAELPPGTYVLGRPWSRGERDPVYRAIPDAAISRSHLEVVVDQDLQVTLRENPEATNPLLVDDERPDGPVVVDETSEITLGDSMLRCARLAARRDGSVDQLGQVAFHRTPMRPVRPEEEVEITALTKVPSEPDPARFSVLSALAPLIGGVVMAVAIQEPRFLIFTVLSPITAATSYFESKKRNREKHGKDIESFEKRLAKRDEEYGAAYAAEETARLAAAPDIADLRRRAEMRDRTLWSRGRDLPEFLVLRVGTGTAEPDITAPFNDDADDEYVEQVEEQNERYASFERVPVTVPLADHGIFGIHGPQGEVAALAKALLIQAVCLHSPEDLVVAAAASPQMGLTDWLEWVPHTQSTGSPVGGRHLASDRAGADRLLHEVLDVAEFREASDEHGVDRRWPWVFLVLDRRLEPDPHLVSQLLDRCPEVGISVLWLSDTADRIPPQCRAVAELADRRETGVEQPSQLWFTDPELESESFGADGVDVSLPDIVARALAPLRDASSATSTASIPRVVPLYAAHGVDDMTTAWVQEQWSVDRRGEGDYAIESVVGTGADGPLVLDLVSDGPHGLIGGTSGAGKSELVSSLVAGLVAYQSPRDLSLLFIDFKGGSSSEVFKDLPHVSGRVTDLDESLALRARVSLRAELRRRVALFSEFAAKDMADMRRLHPEHAPPSLVIVIDEFATLVKQLPEFVAEVIDIAQRGRSYGVHLILATQRPSSSVDDNILANTNLRISLRMLDRAESMSVLNAPDAAEIPVPLKGRCIARLGPGQLVEFQSAYCSAPLATTTGRPPVAIAPLGGAPGAAGPGSDAIGDDEPRTQLDALIDSIVAIGHEPVDQIWNELLPEQFPFTEADRMRRVPGYERDPGRLVLVGGADDPANQRQQASVVDLSAGGGLLVLGTGRSGKTTVLRTIAASAALDDQRAGGGTMRMVVLDCSSGELRSLMALPQCDAVGTLDDLEVATRIIATLKAEIGRRRAAAKDGDDDVGPNILLLVDGYTNLLDALTNTRGQEQSSDQWLDDFHRLVLDGRQVGIYTVMTSDRSGSIRNAVFAAMTNRLVLRLVDAGETSTLGAPPTSSMPPGAGYLDGLRIQVASIAAGGVDDDEAVRAFARILDADSQPLVGPPLPTFVRREALSSHAPVPDHGGVVGVADVSGEVVTFDVSSLDVLVTGPPLSGKSWALRSLAEQLEADGMPVYAFGAEDSGLRQFDWKAAAWGQQEIETLIGTIKAELQFPDRQAVIVADDLDLLDSMDFDMAVDGLSAERRLRFLGSTTSFGYSNNDMVKRIRAARQVLFVQPGSSREVAEAIGVVRLPLLRLGLDMGPGRGMWVRNRIPTVVQVVAPSGTDEVR